MLRFLAAGKCTACTADDLSPMDSGRRTFLLHHPGTGEGNVTALRGSALSPRSTFALSSAAVDDDAALVDDLLRPDIDWTIKYLASDQPRSSLAAFKRLPQTNEGTESSQYGAPVVTSTLRRTEQDLDINWSRHKPVVSPARVNHSTYPLHIGSSVVNHVRDDVTVTSYGGSVPRRMPNNYTDMSSSSVGASYHPPATVLPPALRVGQLSTTSYPTPSSQLKTAKSSDVSFARRKIRRILCRSKGDPNYFDV